mmetsp:Transcript_76159/g.168229  ORF Transcript_76159/g.168229 Transcript_76159/m.168229 type:complete len:207 (-) Transcript_76159:818-1438(-)
MAVVNWVSSSFRVTASSPSLAMEELNSSISDCRESTWSVFSSLMALLLANSAWHQPCLVASSFAWSCIFTISCSIIVFTLAMGSAAARSAVADNTRLFKDSARCWRKRVTCSSCSGRAEKDRRKARDVAVCTRPGRCFSALPATAPLLMMSWALVRASSSSFRNFWRSSKAAAFLLQVALRSLAYFSSEAFSVFVSSKSPSAEALA